MLIYQHQPLRIKVGIHGINKEERSREAHVDTVASTEQAAIDCTRRPRAALRSMAPSLYKWDYVGGEDDSPEAARRGEQRVYAGDLVMDDVFGQGKFVRFEGSDIVIEFGSGETMEHKAWTKGHVRAVANRDARPTRDVPVGRPTSSDRPTSSTSLCGMFGPRT